MKPHQARDNVTVENIPQELRDLPQWCVVKAAWSSGNPIYQPERPNGEPIVFSDPLTFSTFDECLLMLNTNLCHGIAFILTEQQRYIVVELLSAIDDQGNLSDGAKIVLGQLESYSEISHSGKDVQIIAKIVTDDPDGEKLRVAGGFEIEGQEVNVFDENYCVVITGELLSDSFRDIVAIGDKLDHLIKDLSDEHFSEDEQTEEIEDDESKPIIKINYRQKRAVVYDTWKASFQNKDAKYHLLRSSAGLVCIDFVPSNINEIAQFTPKLRLVDQKYLLTILRRIANWIKETKNSIEEVDVPTFVADDMISMPNENLPMIDCITTIPVYSARGELILTRGYDPNAMLWYEPSPDLTKIDNRSVSASPERLFEAKRFLLEDLVVDFEFASEVDKVNLIGALIQPFVRKMIKGATPMFVVSAPGVGVGKTMLCNMIVRVITGKEPGVNSFPESNDEMRKLITSILLGGRQVICIGDLPVDSIIKHKSLASVITTGMHNDRVLGVSREVELPNTALWLLNGNNPQFSKDLKRRKVPIYLVPTMEQPERRTNFVHPDFEKLVIDNRAKIISSVLTLIENWIQQGCPPPAKVKPFGSFSSWRKVIGGVIEAADIHGFLDNLDSMTDRVTEEWENWGEAFDMWYETNGEAPFFPGEFSKFCEKHNLLEDEFNERTEKGRADKIKYFLVANENLIISGYKIVHTKKRSEVSRSMKSAYQIVVTSLPKKQAGHFNPRPRQASD